MLNFELQSMYLDKKISVDAANLATLSPRSRHAPLPCFHQGLRVGSRCIFGGKESEVGKVRESGVGYFENLSQRRSREYEGFWGERVGSRKS